MQVRLLVTLVAGLLCATAAARDDRLVAMVRVSYGGDVDRVGAAVIVASDGMSTTLVTAAHTITAPGLGGDRRVTVEFNTQRGEEFEAEVLLIGDESTLDLAVLSVHHAADVRPLPESSTARQVLYPSPLSARIGDGVYAVGFPGDNPWFSNARPDQITGITPQETGQVIEYVSSVTIAGMSGGGLFSEHGALIGMVLDVGPTGAKALHIDTIRSVLAARGFPFELAENLEALASRAQKQLEEDGLSSNAGLARVLTARLLQHDYLSLYWISRYDSAQLETLLKTRVVSGNKTYAELVIERMSEASTCEVARQHGDDESASSLATLGIERFAPKFQYAGCRQSLLLWFDKSLENGLNPDLLITVGERFEESLLALALEKRAVDVALLLLQHGASPNPYIDLDGIWKLAPRFTHPLEYILDNFLPSQRNRLWEAFLESSVVTLSSVYGGSRAPSVTVTSADSQPVPANCELRSAHTDFDWCSHFSELPRRFIIHSLRGVFGAEVTHMLFADEDRVVFAGTINSPRGTRPRTVILDFNRQTLEMRAYTYENLRGCRRDEDDWAPDFCWRRHKAKSTSATVSLDAFDGLRQKDKRGIWKLDVDGVSLSVSRDAAINALLEKGYVQKVRGDVDDYPDQILTLPFEIVEDDIRKTLTLISVNTTLLGYHYYRAPSYWSAVDTPVASPPDGALWFENLLRRQVGMRSELSPTKGPFREVSVTQQYENYALYVFDRISLGGTHWATSVWARSNIETLAETAFWEEKLKQWLSKPAPPTDGRPCIDEHMWLRKSKRGGCDTGYELHTPILAEQAQMERAGTLEGGIQYEYLERARVDYFEQIIDITPKVVDATSKDSSLEAHVDDRYRGPIRMREFSLNVDHWLPFMDVIPALRIGDRLRLSIPVDAWGSALPPKRRPAVPTTVEVHFSRKAELR